MVVAYRICPKALSRNPLSTNPLTASIYNIVAVVIACRNTIMLFCEIYRKAWGIFQRYSMNLAVEIVMDHLNSHKMHLDSNVRKSRSSTCSASSGVKIT